MYHLIGAAYVRWLTVVLRAGRKYALSRAISQRHRDTERQHGASSRERARALLIITLLPLLMSNFRALLCAHGARRRYKLEAHYVTYVAQFSRVN